MAERVWYLEDDVTVSLVEFPMERFIHLERKKIFHLPYGHTRNLKEGEIKKKKKTEWQKLGFFSLRKHEKIHYLAHVIQEELRVVQMRFL